MLKDKLKAFLVHFALSLITVSLIICLIIYFWYPLKYLELSNFKEISLLIIIVDLVMGPVLTFVVFNKNKKTLSLDLAIVAVLQLSALAYGSYALFQDHPVFITFNQDRFTVINARDALPEKAKYNEYKISKLSTAKFAFAKLPEDINKRNELLFDSISGGPDLDQRTDYYEPYNENIDNILAKGLDSNLIFSDRSLFEVTKPFLEKYNNNINDYAFFPLNSNKKHIILVIDKENAKPVVTLDIEPWKYTKK